MYYHYTDKQGYDGIMRDMCIKQSSDSALFGPGVYLTTISPYEHSHREVANVIYGYNCK